jgi:hypothetical protein
LKKSNSHRSIFDDNEQLASSRSLTPVTNPRLESTNPRPQATIARAAVGHWLLITSVDLLLNAPDNIIRLLIIAGLLCEDVDCLIRWNPFESHIVLTGKIVLFISFITSLSKIWAFMFSFCSSER